MFVRIGVTSSTRFAFTAIVTGRPTSAGAIAVFDEPIGMNAIASRMSGFACSTPMTTRGEPWNSTVSPTNDLASRRESTSAANGAEMTATGASA